MKKFSLILTVISLFAITRSFAQANYNTAAGIRIGGYENGLTLKHFTSSSTAIEGIIGFRPGVFVATGLYQIHAVAFAQPSLNWFYGFGAHIGGIDGDRYYRSYGGKKYYADGGLILGGDGILGLEYTFPEIPLAISADLHPRIELARGPFLNMEAALSIRYTF